MKNSIKQYLDKNNIEAIVFDIDNTLIDTHTYYQTEVNNLTRNLSSKIDPNEDPLKLSKEILHLMMTSYLKRKHKKPILVDEWYLGGLKEYFNDNVKEELVNKVKEHFNDFYTRVPTPYQGTKKVLETFINTGTKMILHSHAQEDWTKMKAKELSKLVNYDLKYLATPLEVQKDAKSWLKAFNIVNTEPPYTLVIGDNWGSDILTSIEAGSKNLIWINNLKEEYTPDGIENARVDVVSDIKEVLDIIS